MINIAWLLEDISGENAGLNIRTLPIAEDLCSLGVKVNILSYSEVIEQILSKNLSQCYTLWILSKPSKPEYIALMINLKQMGYKVGIDIFDNYYSSSNALDSFGVRSVWNAALKIVDFITVSTNYIRSCILDLLDRQHSRQAIIFLLSDRVPGNTGNQNPKQAVDKWNALAADEIPFTVSWFGIESNPYFSVGLDDIYANSSTLLLIKNLVGAVWGNHSTFLFNLCTKNLPESHRLCSALSSIGIPTRFIEWSKDSCSNLLKSSHLAFLPTNNSDFVLSKTHNRLTNALNEGCITYITPGSLYSVFACSACVESIPSLASLLIPKPTHSQISVRINDSLKYIASIVKSDDQLFGFADYISQDIQKSESSSNPLVLAIMGTNRGVEAIKLLRNTGVIVAGLISPLLKSPPAYDHINLIHELGVLRIRFRIDIAKQAMGKSYDVMSRDAFTPKLQLFSGRQIAFVPTAPIEGKYLEFVSDNIPSCFMDLVNSDELFYQSKNFVPRSYESQLLVASLLDILTSFCLSRFGECQIFQVSGSYGGSYLESFLSCEN